MDKPIATSMYQRFKWTAIGRDRIAILKRYEPIQPYILLELARTVEADTFIDIGANIGVYSIFMSSLECVREVHSFEPSPETFDELTNNITLNAISKIKTYKNALSDVAKDAKFGIVSEYSGANGFVEGSIHPGSRFSREETVSCLPLDSLPIETSGRLCLKIDVEGHERKVLAGAEMTLTRHQTVIQTECYEEDTRLSEILSKYGYHRLFRLGPDHYYTNIDALSWNDLLSVFENATKALIALNLEAESDFPEKPVSLPLLPGVSVQVSGGISRLARQIKRRIRTGPS